MPNCDFYAVSADLFAVLDFVFSELPCRVFESYSQMGEKLREFNAAEEIEALDHFGEISGKGPSVLLELWATEASSNVRVEKIALDPGRSGGYTQRFKVTGWGLIQLQLGGNSPSGILHSHTNHNSEARAKKWQATCPEMGDLAEWDWSKVAAVSRKLNHHIRSTLAVDKIGGRPVLEYAAKLLESGATAI